MGKFTNLVLIAAAVVLIVIGVAAQTGTISLGRSGPVPQHGGVSAQQAITTPTPSAAPVASPAPPAAQPVAAPAGAGGGGDGGDGGGGGGDGGD